MQHIQPLFGQLMDGSQTRSRVTIENGFGHCQDPLLACDAQAARDLFSAQTTVPERQHLVQHREGIAHGTRRLPGDDRDPAVVRVDSFFGEDVADMLGHYGVRDQAKIVSLATRPNGDRDLVDFGRREDELHVAWGLF